MSIPSTVEVLRCRVRAADIEEAERLLEPAALSELTLTQLSAGVEAEFLWSGGSLPDAVDEPHARWERRAPEA